MSILKILKYPNPILRKKTQKIKNFNKKIKKIIKDMFDTMYHNNGIGLAANQININKSIIVIDINKKFKNKIILINPKIIKKKNIVTTKEGCLSIPNKIFKTKRFNNITTLAFNENNKKYILKSNGLLSICIQHEVDHLNGKLIIDFIKQKYE